MFNFGDDLNLLEWIQSFFFSCAFVRSPSHSNFRVKRYPGDINYSSHTLVFLNSILNDV